MHRLSWKVRSWSPHKYHLSFCNFNVRRLPQPSVSFTLTSMHSFKYFWQVSTLSDFLCLHCKPGHGHQCPLCGWQNSPVKMNTQRLLGSCFHILSGTFQYFFTFQLSHMWTLWPWHCGLLRNWNSNNFSTRHEALMVPIRTEIVSIEWHINLRNARMHICSVQLDHYCSGIVVKT